MLNGFARARAGEEKRLLLGESRPTDGEQRLRDVVLQNGHDDEIIGFRTVCFGPNGVIGFADLRFAPGLNTESMDSEITALESAMQNTNGDIRKVYIEPEL
jgi:divalent metal cation (Fe/Co/Zn/Cd) transporter